MHAHSPAPEASLPALVAHDFGLYAGSLANATSKSYTKASPMVPRECKKNQSFEKGEWVTQAVLDGERVTWDGFTLTLIEKDGGIAVRPPDAWTKSMPINCVLDGSMFYTSDDSSENTPTQFHGVRPALSKVWWRCKDKNGNVSDESRMKQIDWDHVTFYAFDVTWSQTDTPVCDMSFATRQQVLKSVVSTVHVADARRVPVIVQLPCYKFEQNNGSEWKLDEQLFILHQFRIRGAKGVVFKQLTANTKSKNEKWYVHTYFGDYSGKASATKDERSIRITIDRGVFSENVIVTARTSLRRCLDSFEYGDIMIVRISRILMNETKAERIARWKDTSGTLQYVEDVCLISNEASNMTRYSAVERPSKYTDELMSESELNRVVQLNEWFKQSSTRSAGDVELKSAAFQPMLPVAYDFGPYTGELTSTTESPPHTVLMRPVVIEPGTGLHEHTKEGEWVTQVILDGDRVVWDGYNDVLVNKKGVAVRPPKSWLLKLPVDCVLDGVLFYASNDTVVDTAGQFVGIKPALTKIWKRGVDGHATMGADEWDRVTLYAFDVLRCKTATPVMNMSFVTRQQILDTLVAATTVVRLPCYKYDRTNADTRAAFWRRGAKGVVFKRLTDNRCSDPTIRSETAYVDTIGKSKPPCASWAAWTFFTDVVGRTEMIPERNMYNTSPPEYRVKVDSGSFWRPDVLYPPTYYCLYRVVLGLKEESTVTLRVYKKLNGSYSHSGIVGSYDMRYRSANETLMNQWVKIGDKAGYLNEIRIEEQQREWAEVMRLERRRERQGRMFGLLDSTGDEAEIELAEKRHNAALRRALSESDGRIDTQQGAVCGGDDDDDDDDTPMSRDTDETTLNAKLREQLVRSDERLESSRKRKGVPLHRPRKPQAQDPNTSSDEDEDDEDDAIDVYDNDDDASDKRGLKVSILHKRD